MNWTDPLHSHGVIIGFKGVESSYRQIRHYFFSNASVLIVEIKLYGWSFPLALLLSMRVLYITKFYDQNHCSYSELDIKKRIILRILESPWVIFKEILDRQFQWNIWIKRTIEFFTGYRFNWPICSQMILKCRSFVSKPSISCYRIFHYLQSNLAEHVIWNF